MARLNGRGYLALLGVAGTQRLAELAWSARNLRRSGPGTSASARTFPMMVAVNTALFAVPALTRHGRRRPPFPVRIAAAGGLMAATGLRLWVIRSLGREWNVHAKVPKTLTPVRDGPFRWIRHPNYVAVAMEFVALPTLAGGYAEAAVLSAANAAVLVPRIRGEERLLDAIPAYRRAFAGVPRFIPRRARPVPASPGRSGAGTPSTRS